MTSFDMLPDPAVEYLVLHSGCPRDHSVCLVKDDE